MVQTVRIEAKSARAIAMGHPWVYRQALSGKPHGVHSGAEVEVVAEGRPFLGRGIFDPKDSVAIRIWTRSRTERLDHETLVARFRAASGLRERLGIPERTEAWRVVNAEGDLMPGVIVDRFGEWLALTPQCPSLRAWEDRLVSALAEAVPSRGIYVRDDKRSRVAWGEPAPEPHEVAEPAVRVRVALGAPGKAGLFTDMREARALVAPLLSGKRFLNLFAHTGAWSAAAAAAGAVEVASVDLSRRYLEAADVNVEVSAPGYCAHEGHAGDVFDILRHMAESGRRFDAVLVDPPSFSSSKSSGTFSIKDGYRSVVRGALRVLEPGGLLACATNYRGVTQEQFLRMLNDAAHAAGADLRVLTVLGQPCDYPVLPALPETSYLKFALCRVGTQGCA